MQAQKVGKVESSSNTLAQARERVAKLMNKRDSEEYDFDERLEQAKKEIWEEEQKALEENANRQQDILSYIELYNIKRNLNSIGDNLSVITR